MSNDPLTESCADYDCRETGCPFDLAADAPDDCARTVEARRWREMADG